MTLRRGFRADAERKANAFRVKLGLRPQDRLKAVELAKYIGVPILGPADVPGLSKDHVARLVRPGISDWSAMTLDCEGRAIILHNTSHASVRQESNLFHELAHILCAHPPGHLVQIGALLLRYYDVECEEEAMYFGGALHIPRAALMSSLRAGMDSSSIAKKYCASNALTQYRINVTGVMKQIRRSRRVG